MCFVVQMDRTSILGDTIDYMKELLDKINALQQDSTKHLDNIGIFKQVKPNEILVRNTPKVTNSCSNQSLLDLDVD